MPKANYILPLLALSSLTGCLGLGSRSLPKDRADYSTAIGDSWKRQTLLNIVKLRYLDPPIFVEVGQVVAGYSLETDFNAGGQLSSLGAVQGNSLILGGAAKYIDRPTITYTPLTGNKFLKSLITPLLPEQVFFLIQAGWPADAVLYATLSSLNGLKNQESTIAGVSVPDPNFLRALELLRKIQLSGAVAMRVQVDAQKQQTTLLTIRSKDISPEALADGVELRRLLRLDPEATEFNLDFGSAAINDKEVAVITRSMMQLMITLASQVEIPAQDLALHRAMPGWESVKDMPGSIRSIQIHSSESKPANAFVTVCYHDHWFWIDDGDLKSKRIFSFMMMLFTLADPGETQLPPILTIPAQ